MLKEIFLILPLAFLVSACQEGMSNAIHGDSVELQRQANEEVAFGIAEGNSNRLARARELIEQSL
ncbi:hypothetical protein [Halomonas sp. C05BenzN]|uniref:hypothetical protein n=1 Tax=Halomonas sp. C05BenzN TaxID=3411041 RepID=UPI003B95BCC8